ncbi:MAG TPA: ScyD/ScyE family protein [Thermomicrobiales bacterium]|nr:ScyD/ScyE family protein [Thermomicrobiales bacterium]
MLHVALAGSGGETPGSPAFEPPFGPVLGGPTAAVAQIDDQGCPDAVVTGLPSYLDGTGGVIGVADVIFIDGQLYFLEAAGTEVYANPDTTTGLFRATDDGTGELVADYAAWLEENPPEEAGWVQPPDIPEEFPNPGNPYAMAFVGDELWMVDAVNGLVVSMGLDGTIELVADLSRRHPVPTGIAPAPEGGAYVGTLTAVPYPDEVAKVVHIAPDGMVTDAWTGLTMVTAVAVDASGTLYAVEMSTDNMEEPPFVVPDSGRVVRQTGPASLEPVAEDLLFPIALSVGPDDALYVALPAVGADTGSGMIVRLSDSDGHPTMDETSCAPLAETVNAPQGPVEATPAT